MEADQIIELLNRYKAGTLSPQERAKLESWYISQAANSKLDIDDEELEKNLSALRGRLPLRHQETLPSWRSKWIRISAAAAVLLIGLATAVYLYIDGSGIPRHEQVAAGGDILPGGNKATLSLADGRRIDLSSEKRGIMTTSGKFTYNDGTPVLSSPEMTMGDVQLITVSTPKGGQYQIRLPDGTNVWLNAATFLKYPVSFEGKKERRVELNGEAYFEVAKNTGKPFLVTAGEQVVKVLGTHFNISNYADEPLVKTTLLEGKVEVSAYGRPEELMPGQQTVLDRGTARVEVREVDAEEAVDWKDGMFRFNNERLESIMRKISRWYNAEVLYEDESLKNERFIGVITRFSKASDVLGMLELAGEVSFRIENDKIIVRP